MKRTAVFLVIVGIALIAFSLYLALGLAAELEEMGLSDWKDQLDYISERNTGILTVGLSGTALLFGGFVWIMLEPLIEEEPEPEGSRKGVED